MKLSLLLSAATAFALGSSLCSAATIYTMNATGTFEHDTNGTNSPAPIPSAGSQAIGNGTFAWGNLATDSTANTAVFSGSSFSASDWGGDGTFTSNAIDVSAEALVDITGTGTSTFNTPPAEFFNFFYVLDAGSPVTFASGVVQVDVSSASDLFVGFEFNHNGGSDNANVTALSVDSIPEPSAVLLLSVVSFLGLRRRR